MSVKAWFLSDLHIRDEQEEKSQKLLLFLSSLAKGEREATHLFLVGDIFDLWLHAHIYFVDRYPKIIRAIRAVLSKGIQVHYFEGNHDLYLHGFWQQDVGVRVHEGPAFFNLGKKKCRVEHGDLMNPHDRGYLFLKSFLQSSPVKFSIKYLPGAMVGWVGERASQLSRSYGATPDREHEHQMNELMGQYAQNMIQKTPFDYLIVGHTHVRQIQNFRHQGNSVFAINLGSWFEGAQVLHLHDEGHQFIEL